jgi:hypothetical protein
MIELLIKCSNFGNDFVPAGCKFVRLHGRLDLPLICDMRILRGWPLFHVCWANQLSGPTKSRRYPVPVHFNSHPFRIFTSPSLRLDRLQQASHPVPAAVNGTLGALFTRPVDCPLRLGKTGYLPPVPQIYATPQPPIPTVAPVLPFSLSGASRADGGVLLLCRSSPAPRSHQTTTARSAVLGRTEHRHHHHWRERRSGADGPPPPLLGRMEKQLQEPAAHEVFFTPQRWIFHYSDTICSRCSSTHPTRSHLPLVWLHLYCRCIAVHLVCHFVLSLCSYACCCWW